MKVGKTRNNLIVTDLIEISNKFLHKKKDPMKSGL